MRLSCLICVPFSDIDGDPRSTMNPGRGVGLVVCLSIAAGSPKVLDPRLVVHPERVGGHTHHLRRFTYNNLGPF